MRDMSGWGEGGGRWRGVGGGKNTPHFFFLEFYLLKDDVTFKYMIQLYHQVVGVRGIGYIFIGIERQSGTGSSNRFP
jgi:hypothetical protein